MAINGRDDLFHYTYLNANGYLNKFRDALGLPNLTLSTLAALLKTFKNRTRLAGFIVPNKDGKLCLYSKAVLNNILGMSDDGYFYTKPENNATLKMLHRYMDEWAEADFEAERKKAQPSKEKPSYASDDEDMQKVSDKLIYNDNYGEVSESKIKKIYVTEAQFNLLKLFETRKYGIEYPGIEWISYHIIPATEDEEEQYRINGFDCANGGYSNFNEVCDETDLRYYFDDDVVFDIMSHEGEQKGDSLYIDYNKSVDTTNVNDICRYLIKKYGITSSFKLAGFIMPNGEMLDFSEGQMARTVDHHIKVNELDLYDLEQLGFIRIAGESPGFEVMVMPTPEQQRVIENFLMRYCYQKGSCFVDVVNANGNNIYNKEYMKNEFPQILNDIKNVLNGNFSANQTKSELTAFLEDKKSGRKIHLTEAQIKQLKKYIEESYFVETQKVNIVKKYLDDNFVRGAIPTIGEDGYGKTILIVGMRMPLSDKVKNMTAKQAFYLLQDKFKNIYSEPAQRDAFLKRVLIDWYNGKITREGLLSKNNY